MNSHLEDTYRHKGMRRRLLDTLREKGITDERVLLALDRVPRHFFVEKAFEELAYEDKALPIEEQQTISQPFTVAYQTQLLGVQPREKILEIGTGSGFQSCVLAVLGARVYTIERQEFLYKTATQMFERLDLRHIRSYFKDGYIGLGEFAPFDKILVTAAATEIPQPLLDQLAIGGKLVIPVGDERGQKMLRVSRPTAEIYETEIFDNFRFVPLLRGKNYTK